VTVGDRDWSKPATMAVPKEGQVRTGAPSLRPGLSANACYGFSITANVEEGREEAVRTGNAPGAAGDAAQILHGERS
jgi:hypothetical protein